MTLKKLCLATSLMAAVGGPSLAGEPVVPPDVAKCLASAKPSPPEEEVALFKAQQIRAAGVKGKVTRVYYGPRLDQFGDLRLPAGAGPHPVAIVVHGGAWGAMVTLDYMAPIAALLTKAGFATWNIEYSRLGSGGDWPNSFLSVGAAADYVRELAKTHPLDLNRVISIGHSSGGHYALWLAARAKLPASSELTRPDPLKLKGVISLDGTPDIKAFGQLKRGATVIPALLGNVDAAKMDERFKLSSPVELAPIGVPQFFLTQQSDRLPSMIDYIEKSKAGGDKVEYTVQCPGNHFTTSDSEDPRTAKAILAAAKKLAK